MFGAQFVNIRWADNSGQGKDKGAFAGASDTVQDAESLGDVASQDALAGVFLEQPFIVICDVSENMIQEFWALGFWIVGDRRAIPAAMKWRKFFDTEFAAVGCKLECAIA